MIAINVIKGIFSHRVLSETFSNFLLLIRPVFWTMSLKVLEKEKKLNVKTINPNARDEVWLKTPWAISCEISPNGFIPPMIRYPAGFKMSRRQAKRAEPQYANSSLSKGGALEWCMMLLGRQVCLRHLSRAAAKPRSFRLSGCWKAGRATAAIYWLGLFFHQIMWRTNRDLKPRERTPLLPSLKKREQENKVKTCGCFFRLFQSFHLDKYLSEMFCEVF